MVQIPFHRQEGGSVMSLTPYYPYLRQSLELSPLNFFGDLVVAVGASDKEYLLIIPQVF